MPIFGPDISSYQGTPDFAAVKAAGNDFVVIKVTEGMALHRTARRMGLAPHPELKLVTPKVKVGGKTVTLPRRYVNPTWAVNRQRAHDAGLVVLFYHFARANDPAAEAAYFLDTIGGLQPGEGLSNDWEIPGDAAVWSKAFLDDLARREQVRGFQYMNQGAINGYDWSQVAPTYPLWAAIYDGDPWTFPAMRFWGPPQMKQYTDAAPIPGIGVCDRNSFNGTREQLLAYCKGGSGPSVWEDDMALIQQTDRGIWLAGPGYAAPITGPEVGPMVRAFGSPTVYDSAADFDAVTTACRRGLPDVWYTALDGAGNAAAGQPWASARLAGVDAKTGEIDAKADQVLAAVKALQPSGTVDPAALAAALLADDAAVQKLGDAIAAGLASRVHNG